MVVLITGSTRGIGAALASELRARGHTVVTNGRTGGDAPGDVRDPGPIVAAAGRVDALVNNAAIAVGDWDDIVGTNLTGAWRCARAFLDAGVRRIVNVSSAAARDPIDVAYSVSKAGLEGLVRSLAREDAVVCGVELPTTATSMSGGRGAPVDAAVERLLEALLAPDEHVRGRILRPGPPAFAIGAQPDNPAGVPPQVRTAFAFLADSPDLARPADPEVGRLRSALAAKHRLPGSLFTFGNGSAEILDRAIGAFVEPHSHEHIVVGSPTWAPFLTMAARRRVGVRRAAYDPDAIAAACDRATRLVYVVSPSFPLGRSICEPRSLLRRLPANAVLVWDEAYVEYGRTASAMELLPETERLVVVRTFSKIYGLAGFRVGWAAAGPQTIAPLRAAEPPYPVPVPSEIAAVAALADEAHVERVRTLNAAERERIEAALRARGIPYVPSETCFVWREDTREPLPIGLPEANDRLLERL